MTEQTANVSTDVDNAHTVEVFLSALQDEDFDTAAAQLDDSVVYQNVGVANNVPFAAAFATIPLVVMAIYLVIARRLGAFEAL